MDGSRIEMALSSKGWHHLAAHPAGGPSPVDSPAEEGAATRDQKCGEITPYYLFHPLVPERIQRCCPKVRLIVLLRDPVERALSQFFHSDFAPHNYVPDGSYGVAAASVLSLQSLSVQALQPKHAPRAKALGQTAGYERAGKELALRDRATTQSSEPWGSNAECAPPPRDERGNRE